jgi:outer membrane protein TolC
MKIMAILFLPLFVFAQSYGLRTFIANAAKNNGNIQAKEIAITAKGKEVEAAHSAYWPTLDIGGDYALHSPKYMVSPGQVGNVYVSLNLEVYDGGRKDALLQAKQFEKEASLFEKEAFAKSITLQIVQYYYTIKKLKANLKALQERSRELKAQIGRIRKFKTTGLATQEDVDKLQAVLDNNAYTMENTQLALSRSEENLRLLTGLPAKQLARNYFVQPKKVRFEWFDQIKLLQANAEAIGMNAEAIHAAYMPQVNLADNYHKSHYDDLFFIPGGGGEAFLIDHQNTLSLSANMRLFDNGRIAKQSEAVKYQKLALLSQIIQSKKEQKMQFGLAKKNLRTMQAKLKSAKSALKAAESTYATIKKKFEVGLVDNITFLDALAQKTLTEARYKETIYDNEIAKSLYYYYAGKDPKEFIR